MDVPATTEQFSQAYTDILGAIRDRNGWHRVLNDVRTMIGARASAFTYFNHRDPRQSFIITSGFSAPMQRMFDEVRDEIEDQWWGRLVDAEGGTLLLGSDIISERELRRHPFYQRYAEPLDIAHWVGGVVCRDTDYSVYMTGIRGHSASDFGEESISILRQLLPQASEGIQLHHELTGVREINRYLRVVADRTPFGIVVFDVTGNVQFCNHPALRYLEQYDEITVNDRGVRVQGSQNQAMLDEFISTTLRRSLAGNTDSVLGFEMCMGNGDDMRLTLIPLVPSADHRMYDKMHGAMLLLTREDAQPEASPALLKEVHKLTNAEIRVCNQLIAGLKVDEAAKKIGISPNTARTHLRRIFQKTNTNTQADLIRLLVRQPFLGDFS